jgi:hypothetical protein
VILLRLLFTEFPHDRLARASPQSKSLVRIFCRTDKFNQFLSSERLFLVSLIVNGKKSEIMDAFSSSCNFYRHLPGIIFNRLSSSILRWKDMRIHEDRWNKRKSEQLESFVIDC